MNQYLPIKQSMINNNSILKLLYLISIFKVTSLFAINVELEVVELKLPARSANLIYDYISLDTNFDNLIESYEISIDTYSTASKFSLQKLDTIVDDEMLLDKPRFSTFNTNISDVSVIKKPTPLVALLGFETSSWNSNQGIDFFSDLSLLTVNSFSLAPIIDDNNNYTFLSILYFHSINDFKFVIASTDKISIYDQNLDTIYWVYSSLNSIIGIERIQFDSDSDYEIAVIEENQIIVLDNLDGSVIWSSPFSLSDMYIGNFDLDDQDEFIGKNDLKSSEKLFMFDSFQSLPLWAYSGENINAISINDIDENGIDEITLIDELKNIIRINHIGEVSSNSQVVADNTTLLTLGHLDSDPEIDVITSEQIYNKDLTNEIYGFKRKYESYDSFMVNEYAQTNGEYFVTVGSTNIESRYIIEIIDSVTGLVNSNIMVDDLAIKNGSYEYSVTTGQMDRDENIEILTISYDSESSSHTVNVYDSESLLIEKSITLPRIQLLGRVFQIVAADKNGDGLDEVYLFYHQVDSAFKIREINNELTNDTWDSNSTLMRFESFNIERRVIVENVDADIGEELVFHSSWNLRVLDLENKYLQVHENHLFSHMIVQNINSGFKAYGISGGSTGSTIKVFSLIDGNLSNQINISIPFVRFAHLIQGSIYLIIGQDKVYIYDISNSNVINSSDKVSFENYLLTNILINKSPSEENLYYLGNNFGYWEIKFNLEDLIFSSGFE